MKIFIYLINLTTIANLVNVLSKLSVQCCDCYSNSLPDPVIHWCLGARIPQAYQDCVGVFVSVP